MSYIVKHICQQAFSKDLIIKTIDRNIGSIHLFKLNRIDDIIATSILIKNHRVSINFGPAEISFIEAQSSEGRYWKYGINDYMTKSTECYKEILGRFLENGLLNIIGMYVGND